MRQITRRLLGTTLMVLISTIAAEGAHAQVGHGIHRHQVYQPAPTISPYLRLLPSLTSDNQVQYTDGAYQTYVRPQLEQRETMRRQQQELTQIHTQLDIVRRDHHPSTLSQSTGHRSRFQTYTHYYPQLSAQPMPNPTLDGRW